MLFRWTRAEFDSSYLSRDPVYHQAVFASIMFTNIFRTMYLLRNDEIGKRLPPAPRSAITRLFLSGAATFALGFFVWNLDNIFCSTVTRWKTSVGWPVAFLLEGERAIVLSRTSTTDQLYQDTRGGTSSR